MSFFHSFFPGRVLVNCVMGRSRSTTFVVAYLMLRRDLRALEALSEVRRHRDVRPNDGFLRQLAELDAKMERERKRAPSPNGAGLQEVREFLKVFSLAKLVCIFFSWFLRYICIRFVCISLYQCET